MYLRDVLLYTAWWHDSSHSSFNYNYQMEDTGASNSWRRGWGEERGGWTPPRRESNFPRYTGPLSPGAWRESRAGFGLSRRGEIFSSESYHGSDSTNCHGSDSAYSMPSENSLHKSDRDSSPGSPHLLFSSGHSTHSHPSPSTSHHRASGHSSPTSSSPRRSRHISIESSSSSESEHESGKVCQASSSVSTLATATDLPPSGTHPHFAFPLSIVTEETKKEDNFEGRVLRSHASQHTRSSETRTRKAASLSRSRTSPSVSLRSDEIASRYNTRSKKKRFEERKTESHTHLHQNRLGGRRRVTDRAPGMESDASSIFGNPHSSHLLLESDQTKVSMEKVVDSDSHSCDRQQSTNMATTGESSQSEEEIWVERKVEIAGGKSSLNENASCPSITPMEMDWPEGEGKSMSIYSPPLPRGITEGPVLPSPSLCIIDQYESQATLTATPMQHQQSRVLDQEEPNESNSLLEAGVGGDELPSAINSKETEGSGSWPCNYGDYEGLTSTVMSPQEERDETPPAELLEATHHLVQGEFSEWYRENFQNDPKALQRYLEYYQAMEGRGEREADQGDDTVKEDPPSEEIAHPASDGDARAVSPSVGATCAVDDTDSANVGIDSSKSVTMTLPPDLRKIVHHLSSTQDKEGDGEQEDMIDLTPTQESTGMEYDETFSPVKKQNLEGESPDPLISPPPPYVSADSSLLDVTTVIEGDNDLIRTPRQPLSRKVEKKYSHLQKHALQQFLLRSKPLILSTQTFIR